MRTRITLAALGAALVTSVLPTTPANAVCLWWWEAVTGQCSPCTTAGHPVRELRELGVEVDVQCLA